jgi:hypothetical protein
MYLRTYLRRKDRLIPYKALTDLFLLPRLQLLTECLIKFRLIFLTGLNCQYNETNVMHFLFSLLTIKGLYMFGALLAHPQEALHKSTLYIACVLCQLAAPRLEWNTSAVCAASPEYEQVMLETCTGP